MIKQKRRFRCDALYSALLTFRVYRKTCGMKGAYWRAVLRCGWQNTEKEALEQLKMTCP